MARLDSVLIGTKSSGLKALFAAPSAAIKASYSVGLRFGKGASSAWSDGRQIPFSRFVDRALVVGGRGAEVVDFTSWGRARIATHEGTHGFLGSGDDVIGRQLRFGPLVSLYFATCHKSTPLLLSIFIGFYQD
jgi:hypothetical protein